MNYLLKFKVADEGIRWTKRFASTFYLSELYYQKGISSIRLNQTDKAKEAFIIAVSISKCHSNRLYNQIIDSIPLGKIREDLESIF